MAEEYTYIERILKETVDAQRDLIDVIQNNARIQYIADQERIYELEKKVEKYKTILDNNGIAE